MFPRLPRIATAALLLCLASFSVQAQEMLRPVKLITLNSTIDAPERRFFGKIVAKQTVDLAFQVSGQIVKLPIVEGTRLEKGDLIAQLDLESFQLTLEQSKLELGQAQRNLARRQQLGPDTVSQVTIDDSETTASLAQVAVRNAEYSLRQATLNAPFDALIASRKVENFTTVTAGTSIVRLHDMSELRVEINVPEILFRQAQEGNDGVQIVAIIPEREKPIPLEFREFNAETSVVGQTYAITLAMVPTEDTKLLPGASVTVAAKRKLADTKIIVPSTAIVIDPDKSTHLMQFEPKGGEEGTVRKISVELATDDKGQFVLTSGIESGVEIVMTGVSQLSDGQKVRRFNGL